MSMTHSDMLYQLDISTFYFYKPLLLQIFVRILKNLDLSLSTITFKVNSHVDNHFYKYVYLFQVFYGIKSVFLLKYTLRFCFFIQIWLKRETPLLFFLIKTMVTMVYRKKLFIEKNCFFAQDYVKVVELRIVHTSRHLQLDQ